MTRQKLTWHSRLAGHVPGQNEDIYSEDRQLPAHSNGKLPDANEKCSYEAAYEQRSTQ